MKNIIALLLIALQVAWPAQQCFSDGWGGGSGGGNPGGTDQSVQYNQGGTFSGDSNLQWVYGAGKLKINGDLDVTGIISGVIGMTFNPPLYEAGGIVSFSGGLSDLSDVAVGVYTLGNVLRANGAAFVEERLSHNDLNDTGLNDHAAIDGYITSFSSHIVDTSNPHSVTAAQAGAVALTGDESVAGIKTFTSIPELPAVSPTTNNQAVRKAYVDAFSMGLSWKNAVLDVDLSDPPLAPNVGDRYLVKAPGINGWAGMDNLLVQWDGLNWNSDGALTTGWAVLATDDNKQWTWTGATWTQLAAPETYTAGDGLDIVANQFSVDLADNSLAFDGGDLKVNVDNASIGDIGGTLGVLSLGITNAMLAGSIEDSKLSTISTADKVDWIAVNKTGSTIDDLADVDTVGAADTQYLGYDVGSNTWIPMTASGGGGGCLADYYYSDVTLHSHGASNVAFTNMPALLTEMNSWLRKRIDLTGAVQYRIYANQSAVGFAGADIDIQYYTGSSWLSLSDVAGAGELDIGTGTGQKIGAWADITAGAKMETVFRVVSKDGDGISDPAFRQLSVQVKYNSTIAANGGGTDYYTDVAIHSHPASSITWTNMPIATTEILGSSNGRKKVNLSRATQYRLVARQVTVGAANADLNLQYSLNGTTWYAADTAGAGELDASTAGVKVGAWANLAPGAINDVFIRIVGKEGDATADPAWRELSVQFVQATGGAPSDDYFVTSQLSPNLSNERVLTGTLNQVYVVDGGANNPITLSLPQDIDYSASPYFRGSYLSDIWGGILFLRTSSPSGMAGNIAFGDTSGTNYGWIQTLMEDTTPGAEYGTMLFSVIDSGAIKTKFGIGANDVVIAQDDNVVPASLIISHENITSTGVNGKISFNDKTIGDVTEIKSVSTDITPASYDTELWFSIYDDSVKKDVAAIGEWGFGVAGYNEDVGISVNRYGATGGDKIGNFAFIDMTTPASPIVSGEVNVLVEDPTPASYTSEMSFKVMRNGSEAKKLILIPDAVLVPEVNNDAKFAVARDTVADGDNIGNMAFVDLSTSTVSMAVGNIFCRADHVSTTNYTSSMSFNNMLDGREITSLALMNGYSIFYPNEPAKYVIATINNFTVNNLPSIVGIIPPPPLPGMQEGEAWDVTVNLTGRDRNNIDVASYKKNAAFYRTYGGNIVQLSGTVSLRTDMETDPAWDLFFNANPANQTVEIFVIGDAVNTVYWRGTIEITIGNS